MAELGDREIKFDVTPMLDGEKLARVEVVNIQPGDVLVVRTERLLSRDQRETMCAQLASVFGDVKIAVLEDGMTLDVLRNEQGGAT